MINILRKNQRVLMLVIAVLTIIAFIWLYNPANTAELGANQGRHYLRPHTFASRYRTRGEKFPAGACLGTISSAGELGRDDAG